MTHRVMEAPFATFGPWRAAFPTADDLAWARAERAQRDATGVRNQHEPKPDGSDDFRWIGTLGEAAFARWLADQHVAGQWYGGVDAHPDFRVADWSVGVKTVERPRQFLSYYDVKVQANAQRRDVDDLYAFFAYEVLQGRLLLLGAISRRRFFRDATKHDTGTMLSGVRLRSPVWTLQADRLTLNTFRLLDLLRGTRPEADAP